MAEMSALCTLTDQELANTLEEYGDIVALPFKPQKRILLIKKLNHLQSRNRSVKKGKNILSNGRSQKVGQIVTDKESHNNVINIDSSSILPTQPFSNQVLNSSTSKKITGVVTRSLRRRTYANPIVRDGASVRESPTGNRRTKFTHNGNVDRIDIPTSSDLYPEIALRNYEKTALSINDANNTFESSDSDVDGSSYEVDNKSANTSCSLLHCNSPRKLQSKRNSYPNLSYNNITENDHVAKRSKKCQKLYPENISFGLLALVLTFFVMIIIGYLCVRREFVDFFSESLKGKCLIFFIMIIIVYFV